MSLRVLAVVLCVLFLMAYAWSPGWRKLRPGWLFSTCGAIIMMAVLEHPDMPRKIGIPGINLWNLLMINTVTAWLARRQAEGFAWDLPLQIKKRGLLFCAVMLVAFLRVVFADSPPALLTGFSAFAAYFVNCFKWLLPAIILFDGCRSKEQTITSLLLILSTYVLIALLTIRVMPVGGIGSGEDLSVQAARRLERNVGYHRVDVSMMLAGATWAIYCCSGLFSALWQRVAVWGVCGITLLGQALTGGRMGYVAMLGVGVIFALTKWRKLLFLGPVGLIAVVALVPSVRERMLMGFGGNEGAIVVEQNADEMTSGRVLIWPLAVEGILQRPLVGWGRTGFQLSGIAERAKSELGEDWPHPHNAYLEYLLDTGLLGMLLTLPIYLTLVAWSFRLLRMPDPFFTAVGGVAFSLFMSFLLSAMGAQTLYTRESVVMMWAVSGLLVRVWLEYHRDENGEETGFFGTEPEEVIFDRQEFARPKPGGVLV
ncbi:MAG: O-antigen polymerase [Verrucomicrobiales bacterium]|nr:O-antigen polymerase [Verrucomicrobiales bacterium]